MTSPDILGDLGVSLLRFARARPGERRSPRSAKESLPSVGLVHDKTWQGQAMDLQSSWARQLVTLPRGTFESSGST